MAIIAGKANKANNNISEERNEAIISSLVYMNDGVRICAEACSCCWDKPIPEDYEGQAIYLGKRSKIGHTSVLEHSNFIVVAKMGVFVDIQQMLSIFDFLSSSKYLNIAFAQDSKHTPYLLVGGSYRGFDEMYKMSKNPNNNNRIMRSIAEIIYENIDSRMFYDLTTGNILNPDRFINVEPDPVSKYFNELPEKPMYESDRLKFVSVDNVNQIKQNLITIIGEDIFTMDDIAKVASLTILFKDMSRTATHQLVRHRNAITQESQRYVDYSNAAFADPVSFKPGRYEEDKEYEITFGGVSFSMTSMELGNAITGIYHNMKDQGMQNEDARSFLPGNVKCRKLYMTFTYKNYLKFLELRCDKAAQAEIRTYALECRDASESIYEALKDNIKTSAVDEIISDKEEIMKTIIENEPELNGSVEENKEEK